MALERCKAPSFAEIISMCCVYLVSIVVFVDGNIGPSTRISQGGTVGCSRFTIGNHGISIV